MTKTALISGITGQDGAYLAKLLLDKGYVVHGLKRRTSLINTARIDEFFENKNLHIHYGDVTDSSNIISLVKDISPDEIYNLAAQSHVHVSFKAPEYTSDTNSLGTLRFLEAIRICDLVDKTRYYQASTSELYGKVQEIPQSETTPFYPRSPYAVAKLYAYWMCRNYRESYGMYAVNGILFNHESPLRGETFVTRKITQAVANIKLQHQECLTLGNLDAERDWGHARDYVKGMWLMLQHSTPEDFVLATGKKSSVREFVKLAFSNAGIELEFRGSGLNEIGVNKNNNQTVVKIDPRYIRPAEVDLLLGNPKKAKDLLGWEAETSLADLCKEMVLSDIINAENRIRKSSRKKTDYVNHISAM